VKQTNLIVCFVAVLTFSQAKGHGIPLAFIIQEQLSNQRTVEDLLSLSGSQLVSLDELWDYLSAKREDQEKRLAKKRPQPSRKDLDSAEKEVRRAFDTAKLEAKRILLAGQVYLLEQRANEVRTAPESKYKTLYTMELAEFVSKPIDFESARRWREAKNTFGKRPLASLYGSDPWRSSGFSMGFGFGHHHHFHNGHIHHHGGY
jgi:hypothetical protein